MRLQDSNPINHQLLQCNNSSPFASHKPTHLVLQSIQCPFPSTSVVDSYSDSQLKSLVTEPQYTTSAHTSFTLSPPCAHPFILLPSLIILQIPPYPIQPRRIPRTLIPRKPPRSFRNSISVLVLNRIFNKFPIRPQLIIHIIRRRPIGEPNLLLPDPRLCGAQRVPHVRLGAFVDNRVPLPARKAVGVRVASAVGTNVGMLHLTPRSIR